MEQERVTIGLGFGSRRSACDLPRREYSRLKETRAFQFRLQRLEVGVEKNIKVQSALALSCLCHKGGLDRS